MLSPTPTPTPISLPGVPPLNWLDSDTPGNAVFDEENQSITITTTKETDWFNPPPDHHTTSSPAALSNAPALVFQAPQKDWQLSAKVCVNHQYLFDAGTIFIHQGPNDWCKLCFEYSPEEVPVVVSVVTRDISDDANGPPITNGDHSIYLRVSKYSSVLAFHYSIDAGKYWTLHRAFSMRGDNRPMSVGFLAQAPVGDSCTAIFSEVKFTETTLGNLRDGS
jgi:regulation of enolase protein 1 (concanavalin A-like superfamily)